jgi:hypothetical protein
MNAFTGNLRNLFQVISQQQEELTAFNEETEAMNQELENVNNRLVMREALWEEPWSSPTPSPEARIPPGHFLHPPHHTEGRGGLRRAPLVSGGRPLPAHRVERVQRRTRPFTIPKNGIGARKAFSTGAPLWVEDISRHPSASPVHPP